MGKIDKMVDIAIGIAKDDSHGYSQYRRWPSEGKDFDCSSLMYYCANKAGYNVPLSGYTGTMVSDFKAAGFSALKFSSVGLAGLKKGDILLNVINHTEMCIGSQFVGAHGSETGGIDGLPGDQTGNEISICSKYVPSYGWDYVLRPPADSGNEPTAKPAFRVSTQASGKTWLAENKLPSNGRIRWIAVEGAKKYRVKTADGWLPYVTDYDITDLDYGCAGDGSLITAIDIRL